MKTKIVLMMALLTLLVSCGPSQDELTRKRIQGLSEMAELGTVEYTVKKIIKTKGTEEWFKYGKRIIAFSCTAFIKAGVNMKDFSADKVAVNKLDNSISVVLPKAQILSFNMPPEMIKEEYANITGLRDRYSPEEKQDLLIQGEEDIRDNIPTMGILEDAEANARLFFTAMFSMIGYDKVIVNFE